MKISSDNLASLIAQKAYSKPLNLVNSGYNLPEEGEGVKAKNFHKAMETSFNNLRNLTQDQILSKISNHKNSHIENSSFLGESLKQARSSLEKRDFVVRKALVNEASITDLATTTNAAKNTVETIVKIREVFLQAWDKIYNMQI